MSGLPCVAGWSGSSGIDFLDTEVEEEDVEVSDEDFPDTEVEEEDVEVIDEDLSWFASSSFWGCCASIRGKVGEITKTLIRKIIKIEFLII